MHSYLKKLILFICFFICIKTFAVFANTTDTLIVDKIILEGNNLTKDKIILRELLFKKGDKIPEKQLKNIIKKSEDNLLNTSLFNFASIHYEVKQTFKTIFYIKLQERWYIWPYPILDHADRNFSSFLKNKEWSRVDYGLYLLINNFRGRKEILKLKTIFGYNNSFILHYNKPFVDKKQKLGMGFELSYSRNHELPFNTSLGKLEYLKLNENYAGYNWEVSYFMTYRPYIYTNNLLNIKYFKKNISDSLFSLNNRYFYNNKNEITAISIDYVFSMDKRNSKIYPLTGERFLISIHKTGLWIFSNEGLLNLRSIIDENIKLYNRFFLNTSVEGQFSFGNTNSFYFSKAIGYNNYIRGTEYYTTHGASYYISKTNFKYELLPQKKFNLKFIPSKKFSKAHLALYFNMFFDTGYVYSSNKPSVYLENQFLYSGGFGLDIVTYYDKILRIEYSFNKFGEQGVFLHLGAPIIKE